jgi:hypothetical protein
MFDKLKSLLKTSIAVQFWTVVFYLISLGAYEDISAPIWDVFSIIITLNLILYSGICVYDIVNEKDEFVNLLATEILLSVSAENISTILSEDFSVSNTGIGYVYLAIFSLNFLSIFVAGNLKSNI